MQEGRTIFSLITVSRYSFWLILPASLYRALYGSFTLKVVTFLPFGFRESPFGVLVLKTSWFSTISVNITSFSLNGMGYGLSSSTSNSRVMSSRETDSMSTPLAFAFGFCLISIDLHEKRTMDSRIITGIIFFIRMTS